VKSGGKGNKRKGLGGRGRDHPGKKQIALGKTDGTEIIEREKKKNGGLGNKVTRISNHLTWSFALPGH